MHRVFIIIASALVGTGVLSADLTSASAVRNQFLDPVDTPALPNRLGPVTQLGAVARAGTRLVAVGVRGLILVSDDSGKSWRQMTSPVSSDLVAVHFVSERLGWATGHDGVILATADAGDSWSKQLDGRISARLLTDHFSRLVADGDEQAKRLLAEVQHNYQSGPEGAILSIWFETPLLGWAVGSFGTILGTEDGGKSWQSWMERVDNEKMFHFNAIRGLGGEVYIASERGVVFKLDRARNRFVPLATGYAGSYFGIVGAPGYIIAFGLRGSAYRSRDAGKSWHQVATGALGAVTSGTVLVDGRLVLMSQDGRMLISADDGASFKSLPVVRPDLFTDIVETPAGTALLTGKSGAQVAALH